MSRPTYVYQECSATSEVLDEALAKAQGEFKKVRRNREGPYGMFADLSAMEDATKPALAKHGLSVRQTFMVNEDKSMILVTRLSCKGEFTVSTIPIPFFPNPQHTHSFCTYMARLGYARILCLSVDDASDGEDIPDSDAEAGVPPQGDPGPDLAAIKTAFAQAPTADRVQALWQRVLDLNLSNARHAQAEKARDAAIARLSKAKEKQQ
jgi:hypothetical protein